MKDNLQPDGPDETHPLLDRAVENLCRVMNSVPVEMRARLRDTFVETLGPIPEDWRTIVDKIVKGECASGPGFKIKELWAYVSEEPDGTEGICGWLTKDGMRPMIGADKERVVSLRPKARDVALASGMPVKLVKFSAREDVEDIKP